MDSNKVKCSKCGFGYDYEKIIGAIYYENFELPYEEYWKRRAPIDDDGKKLHKYMRDTGNGIMSVDYERLSKEDPDFYSQMKPLFDEQDALDDLETSYLTDGKLLLLKGKCIHCGQIGTLR